jgi:signal transduction histidine kinase
LLKTGILERWNQQTLARQFLFAGGIVSLVAMLLVGAFVTNLIEDAVTRNSAATTALYVDSIIAPILPDLKTTDTLDDVTNRVLDETFGQGALGEQVVSFRLWRADGTVLYATDKTIQGKRFPPGKDLTAAFSGKMVAQFDYVDDAESFDQRSYGKPLLEIYNPILQPWSGEVIAVTEFYEVADGFQKSLSQARLLSWLAVAGMITTFFLLLSAIVFKGSRMIEAQQRSLTERVVDLQSLLTQNRTLHSRAQRASQRATALNESYLRRLGADLHDGPAQLVAYAALRVDSALLVDPEAPLDVREVEIAAIKARLQEAMDEIRSICSGLVLPQIEAAAVPEILEKVVGAHRERTAAKVDLSIASPARPLLPSAKICIYRFVQEALNNGYRHGGGKNQVVSQTYEGNTIVVVVSDEGPGFDKSSIRPGGLGIAGLRERIESLGGTFDLTTSSDGTTVRMSLTVHEPEHA